MSQGLLTSVNTSPGGIPKLPRPTVPVNWRGLEGDGQHHAKHGGEARAVSLIDAELYAAEPYSPFKLAYGALGENLTVSGVEVQSLLPGERLRFGSGVEIEITEPRTPCYVLDAIDPGLQHKAWGKCGVMARVLREGTFRQGDSIERSGNTWTDNALPKWPHTVIILAGGNSSRMGQPKEGVLLPDGRRMLDPILEAAQAVAREVVVSGACTGHGDLPPGVKLIPDLHPGLGPLGGILSVMEEGEDTEFLVLSNDMPGVTPYILRLLTHARPAGGRFFRDDAQRRLQHFPGVFPIGWHSALKTYLLEGGRSVKEFLHLVSYQKVTIPGAITEALRNINTPEDLAALGLTPQQVRSQKSEVRS